MSETKTAEGEKGTDISAFDYSSAENLILSIVRSLTPGRIVFIGFWSARRYIHELEAGKMPFALGKYLVDAAVSRDMLGRQGHRSLSTRAQQFPLELNQLANELGVPITIINIDVDFRDEPILASMIHHYLLSAGADMNPDSVRGAIEDFHEMVSIHRVAETRITNSRIEFKGVESYQIQGRTDTMISVPFLEAIRKVVPTETLVSIALMGVPSFVIPGIDVPKVDAYVDGLPKGAVVIRK